MEREKGIAPPATISEFTQTIGDLVEREAIAFYGERPTGLLLILDDFESLRDGRFLGELRSLRDLLRKRGWQAELGYPADTRWDGRRLTFEERPVSFIINRSTDFLWRSDDFAALREAYQTGSVYAAPNPFTYVTRSNKRLLEWLSLPQWDGNHGIDAEERRILSAHVPVTHVLRADNVDMLAQGKRDFVFKPMHGFASRGLLDSAAVGRVRLRRLLRAGEGYVAQRRVGSPGWKSMERVFGPTFAYGRTGARYSLSQGAPRSGRTGLPWRRPAGGCRPSPRCDVRSAEHFLLSWLAARGAATATVARGRSPICFCSGNRQPRRPAPINIAGTLASKPPQHYLCDRGQQWPIRSATKARRFGEQHASAG